MIHDPVGLVKSTYKSAHPGHAENINNRGKISQAEMIYVRTDVKIRILFEQRTTTGLVTKLHNYT